jgi:uncharacterized integral membrane protein
MTTDDQPVEPTPPGAPAPDGPAGGNAIHHDVEPTLGARLEESRQTFQPGLWALLVVGSLALLYLVLFVVLNTNTVRVSFVFGHKRASLIWVIVLSGLLGTIFGVLLSQLHRFRGRRRSRKHAAAS